MNHTRNKSESVLFITALALGVLALFFLWNDGYLPEQFGDWRTYVLFGEGTVLFLCLLAADRYVCTPQGNYGLILFLSSLFLWIHRIFLPVLVTGFYMIGIMILGEDLLLPLRRREGRFQSRAVKRFMHDFLTGSAALQIFLTALSVLHAGGPGIVRKAALALFTLAFLFFLLFWRSGLLPLLLPELPKDPAMDPKKDLQKDEANDPENDPAEDPQGRRKHLQWILILTLLLIHAGRMNITLDYDSVHYGLRSFYILDNGRGFFENLGSVNAVYYYPKGLELLTLPLSGTPTVSFVLSFSYWCGVLVLFLVRETVSRHSDKEKGDLAALFCACTPGIMNMATSAKTDMVTLLFQLLFIREVMDWMAEDGAREDKSGAVRFRRLRCLLWGIASLLMTLTFKPTAIAFSGVLFLSFLFCAAVRVISDRKRAREDVSREDVSGEDGTAEDGSGEDESGKNDTGKDRGTAGRKGIPASVLLILMFPAAALFGVTGRTYRLTGYPLVTVFTGIWEKLGMHGKYPMAVLSVPDASAGRSIGGRILHLAERCFLFLFAPVGDDGLHIRIAWGTPLFVMLLLFILITLIRHRGLPSGSGRAAGCLFVSFAFLLLFDLVTLVMLYQVDGNYYNLSYALAAMCASMVTDRDMPPGRLAKALLPALLSAVFFTCVTNWAGARGLTEPKLNHYGFYDHASDRRDTMILSGKDPVYRYLMNAARLRVLCMAEEPDCYLFPCVAESYTDLEGSGGNVQLVHTLNEFKDYLDTACIPLLYAEKDFLGTHARAEELVRFMEEDGSITPIISQEGYVLYEYHTGIR